MMFIWIKKVYEISKVKKSFISNNKSTLGNDVEGTWLIRTSFLTFLYHVAPNIKRNVNVNLFRGSAFFTVGVRKVDLGNRGMKYTYVYYKECRLHERKIEGYACFLFKISTVTDRIVIDDGLRCLVYGHCVCACETGTLNINSNGVLFLKPKGFAEFTTQSQVYILLDKSCIYFS